MARVAGVDVGGTSIEAAIVDDDHEVGDRAKIATPTDGPDAVVAAIVDLIDDLDKRPDAIGLGVPGLVSDGVLKTPPNLENFPSSFNMRKALAKASGRTVAVDNDVNVAVLGEWVAGAGRGSRFVLGVWMGTGVGGGLVLDGRPYSGPTGAAGEFGHIIVRADGAQCGCGRRGCVEAYAGRANMVRFIEQAVSSGGFETELFEVMEDVGKDRPTSKVWAKTLDDDDELASRVFAEGIEAIAIGVANVINLLDVDRVIFGGGIADRFGSDLADRIKDEAARHVFSGLDGREFAIAELGDDSGMVGAAELARAALVVG